jgi:NifU-like protein involved in Fe-S cluster formation
VGTGIVGVRAPDCGDVMLQINTFVDTNFKTFGCGSAIAV